MRTSSRLIPSARRALVAAFLGSAPAFVIAACSSSSGGDAAVKALLSEGCNINSDCNSPLVCAFRRCHTECLTTRDCPAGQRCMASDRPFHVCQLPTETKCAYNSDCPMGQVCGADGQCRDQCSSDRDCVSGQKCISATCAEPAEVVDGGALIDASASDAGLSCSLNSDCASPLICRQGFCGVECKADVDCPGGSCLKNKCVAAVVDAGPQCVKDTDCPSGNKCTASKCVPTATDASMDVSADVSTDGPKSCVFNSDCGAGQLCHSGTCGPECAAPIDCPVAGSMCVKGACVPPASSDGGVLAPCTLNSDCSGGLVCKQGHCRPECVQDKDCDTALGECCINSFCSGKLACGATDAGIDAPPDALPEGGGKPCKLDFECDDGVFCNGAERCLIGQCAPPASKPCDGTVECVTYACDEAGKKCGPATMTVPADSDGDGHKRVACGGDDCNDNDPSIYTGAPELCDGKDNDCNGTVDDGAFRPRGNAFGPMGVTFLQPAGNFGGGLVAFQDGFLSVQPHQANPATGQFTFDIDKLAADGSHISGPTSVGPFADTGNGSSCNTFINYVVAGPSTVLILYNDDCQNALQAVVIDANLKLVGAVIGLQTQHNFGRASAAWTGTDYLVSWQNGNGGAMIPSFYAAVLPNGTLAWLPQPLPTPAGDGLSNYDSHSIAASGATRAIVYQQVLANKYGVYVAVVGASGNALGTPMHLGTDEAPITVAASPSGYIVATEPQNSSSAQALNFTAIGFDGLPLSPPQTVTLQSIASGGVQRAAGFADTHGTGFYLLHPDGLRWYFFRQGDLTQPDPLLLVGAEASTNVYYDRVYASPIGSAGAQGLGYFSSKFNTYAGATASCLP